MEPILELQGVGKRLGDFQLRDISFTLPRGYIMGFIGQNGAGKTTLIKLIFNLLKLEQGRIKIFGKDHKKYEMEIKQKLGFVLDDFYFYENLSIEEVRYVVAGFYKSWDNQLFDHYLQVFALDKNSKVKNLSKGMKMKLALALALAHHAELIIMDEPTAGLDPIIRAELLEILYELIQDEKKSILFSTHLTSDLEKVADYITFIEGGELLFSKTLEEIRSEYKVVQGKRDLLKTNAKDYLLGFRESSFNFEGLLKAVDLEKIEKKDLICKDATLEEIMLYTVRREKHA